MADALISRSRYPSLVDYVYLNQAALGLMSQATVASMHAFLDDTARHGSLRMTDDDEVEFFESLRRRGARILHCDTDRLAILASASELLGQLPFMIRPKTGSHIVAVSTDFPAVTRPWIRYAVENDCFVRFVDDLASENLTDRLITSIDERTTVVAVSSVQYSTGSRVDIPRLREASVGANARLIVDVTQAAGMLKIDSRAWEADAVVTSGYKWLGGHGGVALAAVSPTLLEQVPPLPGWMGATNPFDFDATRLPLAAGARRLTQSTMSYVSMAGLVTALDQLLSLSESRLEAHAQSLSRRLIKGARAHGWKPFRSIEDPSASAHIVALSHAAVGVEETVDVLRHNRIVCGVRNGRIRVSLAPYNNFDDIDAFVDVLAKWASL